MNVCPYLVTEENHPWPINTCTCKLSYCCWPISHDKCPTFQHKRLIIDKLLAVLKEGANG